ncbi:MAG: YidC/Oxa1 family membrane protein insertase [Bacillota bacterium]|nr:YidC/Oxa1 family membrane protein insertase [Bacillota bacterium]
MDFSLLLSALQINVAAVNLWQGFQQVLVDFLEWLFEFTLSIGMPSYVLALFVFTLIVKLLLQPLMNKQLRSNRQMQRLQPQINALKKRYAANPQKLQQETMKLYKANNASPTAGCLPLLVQMPIIIALFQALRTYDPGQYEQYYQVFGVSLQAFSNSIPGLGGWAMPVICAASTFLQQYISTINKSDRTQAMMLYMFPLMFLIMVRQFPIGLSIYWSFYSLIGAAIYWPLKLKWEREDKKRAEEEEAARLAEAEEKRARKAAAIERAKKKKGGGKNKAAYVVAEDDYAADDELLDGEEAEEPDEEVLTGESFEQWLERRGIGVKSKKMKLHPYSLEEETVELAVMPNGKERELKELRAEYDMQYNAQQRMAQVQDMSLKSLFGGRRKKPALSPEEQELADAAAAGAETDALAADIDAQDLPDSEDIVNDLPDDDFIDDDFRA